MTEITTTIQSVVVHEKGFMFDVNKATDISIDDEGAGLFVTLKQGVNGISINPEEWPAIRQAVNRMMAVCKSLESN